MTTSRPETDPFATTADSHWILQYGGDDPIRESNFESRLTISNGFMGIRGTRSVLRGEGWVVPPHTYVAGLFDTPSAGGAVPGLVPAADWLRVLICTPDGSVPHSPDEVSDLLVRLDMKRGLLVSDCRQMWNADLVVRLQTLRLVSLHDRAIGLQLIRLEIERGALDITLEASFEGASLGMVQERLEQDLGVWRTRHSGKGLAMAVSADLQVDDQELVASSAGSLAWQWSWRCRPGQHIDLERIVAVTRNDCDGDETGDLARVKLADARGRGWGAVLADHEAAWAERWRASEIEIDGDPAAQDALRFSAYHLNSAANPADDRVSIGARALTGDDYLGHVFWDTEIFLLPFYILTWPEAARALLTYRFHTLDAARAKAAGMGWRGALYAWESTDTGAEATPLQVVGPDRRVIDIQTGAREQHISADVAYAIWQYWQATGDEAFLRDQGAEILLETGRFWASRATREPDGLHHIRGVIGPDEYHLNVDDNAFTNVMAQWNIARALEVASLLGERWPDRWKSLSERLELQAAELGHWRRVADTLATGRDAGTGLYEAFEGYFGLEAIDLTAYLGRSVPMDVVLGRERTAKSQVVKQADVVALLALLPEAFPGQSGAENFRFYEPRCSHGSSLSTAMHGLVAARLGESEMALRFFRKTASIDLGDAHVAIQGGVHIAAQGGLWQMTVFGFAGLSITGEFLTLDPRPPEAWDRLRFRIQWRGRQLRFDIRQHDLEIVLEAGPPTSIRINGQLTPIATVIRTGLAPRTRAVPRAQPDHGSAAGRLPSGGMQDVERL
jgi:trehalose/maltose hydrolase-like predicted phosphorylase